MPRDLCMGMTGDDVSVLQGMLNFHLGALDDYVALRRDGRFGPKTNAAVIRFQRVNLLDVDGIVGEHTRAALLDARFLSVQSASAPDDYGDNGRGPSLPMLLGAAPAAVRHRVKTAMANAQTVGDTPAPVPTVDARSIVVGAGEQFNFFPWYVSPIVVSAQWNIAIRNFGRPPFVISPGVQFFQNQYRSPSGSWTGQGFIQMGPSELFKRGRFDLLNPFVQLFVQKNDGQPASAGFSVGNQSMWWMIQDQLAVFLNIQQAFGVDLSTGKGIPPPLQIYGGVQVDILKFLLK